MSSLGVPAAERRETAAPDAGRAAPDRRALVCAAVALATFAVFCALVALSRRPVTYDEPGYLATVRLVDLHGLGVRFLRSLPEPAGPLYTVVHWLARPLTGLAAPGVRVVSLLFTAATALAMVRCVASLGAGAPPLAGADVLCVPGLGAVACLALTETPAIFFAALSLLLLAAALGRREGAGARLALGAAAGVCFGIAILGRQPYLLALGAVPLAAAARGARAAPVALAFGLAAAAVCVPVFAVWGSVLPPAYAEVPGSGLVPGYAVLGAGYAAFIMAVLAPRYLAIPPRWAAAILLGGTLVNAATGAVRITPLSTVASRLLSPPLVALYTHAASALLVGAGLLFVAATVRNCYLRRSEPVFLFAAAGSLLIVASCATITFQFSSRYVVVAAPMLVVAAAYYTRASGWKALRLAAGAAVNVLAVWGYLY
ncbi:MAG TPA: hypothetical protein VF746_17280 [Longimicrobium sp.]|jgi:4-amino-4-deoxy-L-arabinose transferase-like glycosyltransferase